MAKETRASELFRPLTTLSVVAALMLFITGLVMAYSVDDTAKRREQALVAEGVKTGILDLYEAVKPILSWDETIRHLERYDTAWTTEFIAGVYHRMGGFEYSFVLDHDNRLFFASHKGVRQSPDLYRTFAGSLHKTIETIRANEAWSDRRDTSALRQPLIEHNIIEADGRVYIAVAGVVQPDFRPVQQLYDRAPIVIAIHPLDGAFLKRVGARYLQPDLKLRQVQMPDRRSIAQIDLNDDQGHYVATVEWKPDRPGLKLATRLAVPGLTIILVFFAVMMAMHRRSWQAAQALIASEARASHMAYHDPLTGLPNRVMFFDRLAAALDQVRRNNMAVAVHCIDLDRFKEVNDTYGHQIGDELIVAAARRISEICRRTDTFARLSGDEFAIVQLNATPLAAARLAERIVKAMSQPIELSGGWVHISCSLGVNIVSEILPHTEVLPAEVLRQADLALYRAKHEGRDQCCFFEPEMDAAMRMRRDMERDLRVALSNGELRMAYQPQADKNGRIVGVEALVRWRHPTRGDVSPALFIHIAEECGLINDIGFFTFRESFRASHRWPGLKVAINISASQLRLRDFHQRVEALVAECAVDPRNFELEITEGLLLGDDQVTHDTLMKLRDMGFSIALDDFGTGYSSLSYLQRYPIDKIKIDRSFVANLGVENEAGAVVHAIVKLARALRLHVIAEGVETDEQRDYLINVGCEEIQGFLYSRPVEAAEIEQMYKTRREQAARRA